MGAIRHKNVTLFGGSKAVATTGTAVPLSSTSVKVRALMIQAKKVAANNTGNVFIGDSNLDQGVAEQIELASLDAYELPIPPGAVIDLADVYVDADNSADGVTFLALRL